MTACWEQVGAVLKANALLSRARAVDRGVDPAAPALDRRLAPARALTYAAPLTGRAPLGAATVRAAIAPTTLPDAIVDPALRRLLAPTGRFVRKAAADRPEAAAVGARFVDKLAAGSMAVDPTDFVPAGVMPPTAEPPPPPPPPDAAAGVEGRPARRRADHLPPRRPGPRQRRGLRGRWPAGRSPASRCGPRPRTRAAPAPGSCWASSSAAGSAWSRRPHDRRRPRPADRRHRAERGHRPGVGALAWRGAGSGPRLPPMPCVQDGYRSPCACRPGRRPAMSSIGHPIAVEPPSADHDTADLRGPDGHRAAARARRPGAQPLRGRDRPGRRGRRPGRRRAGTRARSLRTRRRRAALTARCHPSNAHVARVGTMVRFGDTSLDRPARRRASATVVTVAPTVRPDHGLPGAGRARLPAARAATTARGCCPASTPSRPTRSRCSRRTPASSPRSSPASTTSSTASCSGAATRPTSGARRCAASGIASGVRAPPTLPRCTSGRPTDRSSTIAGGESNLVLLIRGELLRRYPNTVVLAIPATGPATPSSDETMVKRPIFSGFLEPDIAFFGFDLEDDDLRQRRRLVLRAPGADHRASVRPRRDATGRRARPRGAQAAWPDTGIAAGSPFTVEDLRSSRRRTGCSRARRRRDRGRGPVPEPRPGARPRSPPDVPRRPDARPRPDRIARHRAELGALTTDRTALGRGARRPPGRARRPPRDRPRRRRALEQAERRVAELERRRAALHEQRADLSGLDDLAAAGCWMPIDAEAAVESLDGTVPVALLPVRIETRFADANTVPGHPHLPRPDPPRRPRAGAHRRRAGRRRVVLERAVAGARRRGRAPSGRGGRSPGGSAPAAPATWSTRCARPTSTRAPDEPPAFPETATRASSWTRAVEATALPERWVAIGYQDDPGGVPALVGPGARPPGRRPVARRSRRPAAARRRRPRPARAGRVPLGGRPRAAREAGMLLTVRDSDLAFGRRWPTG